MINNMNVIEHVVVPKGKHISYKRTRVWSLITDELTFDDSHFVMRKCNCVELSSQKTTFYGA